MSSITMVYNALHARLATLLPNHVRLSNPYALEQNSVDFLRQGYAIAIRSAFSNSDARNIIAPGCKRYSVRDFDISITEEYTALETDGVAKDVTALSIMENMATVIDDLILDNTLNQTDDIKTTSYSSDDGISTIFDETDRIYSVTATFSVEYADTI